jgi:chromosome segregation ATPase
VSTPLEIQFEKPLTLIYGQNGTGKTSICDALDFLVNGDCGSLGDNSVSTSKYKYWPFVGGKASDASVQLSLTDGSSWRGSISGTKVSQSTSSTRRIPKVKVWRRKQMMDLILAKPADRFKVISDFIDVNEINRSEQAVRDLQRKISGQLQIASTRITENYSTLESQCRLSEGDVSDPITWAKHESEKKASELDDEIKYFSVLVRDIDSLISLLQSRESVTSQSATLKDLLDSNENIYNEALSKVTGSSADTLDLLSEAKKYFESKNNELNACPLCESKENFEGLPMRISSVIDSYSDFNSSKEQYLKSKKEYGDHLEKIASTEFGLVDKIEELSHKVETFRFEFNDLEKIKKYLIDTSMLSEENLTTIREAIDQHKNNLVEKKGKRSTIELAYKQYTSNLEEQNSNNILKPKIDRILEIHEVKRKVFVDGILSSIAGEVGRLYEAIHPKEGLDKIALQLDPKKRESLEIQAEFQNENAPPGAYFSNSHLDSLGLCILLALAIRDVPEDTVLILDDVLGSIDEPHADRIVQLIYSESANFMHTLVTTHYQRWHALIRNGQLRVPECQLIELKKWDPQLGVILQESARSMVELLRENISKRPNEPEPIAQLAGYLLEQVCDWLVSKYELSIPKRKNTANDYLDALKEKYSKQLIVEKRQGDGTYVETELKQLLTDIRATFQIRNIVGAHFNELASHLTTDDSLDFGKKVLELADLLICKDEGFPVSERANYLSTPSETRRLYPVRMKR